MMENDSKPIKKKRSLPAAMEPYKFKKGNKGGGRPKGSLDLWGRLRRLLRAKDGDEEVADKLMKAILRQALKGKWPQQKEILDRELGSIKQQMDHTTDGEPFKAFVNVKMDDV